MRLQNRCAPDAGQLEQLRTLQRPRGEQNLAPGTHFMFDAVLAVTHSSGMRACDDERRRVGRGLNP